MPERQVTTPDGRTLRVLDQGAPDGPALVGHHGAPGSALHYRAELESARERGARLIAYDRPGYGGSTPHRGRTVADAASDVGAILDALGVERFATYGWSGGGPYALACAALLGQRCAAAVTIAGVAPADMPDMLAGMNELNVAAFGAARDGREPLTELLREAAAGMLAVAPEQVAHAFRPHLSDVDFAALTGELATFMLESMQAGLEPGVGGWVDDDLAFVAPWGFNLAAIDVPVSVLQGEHDLNVPPAHGRWLRDRLGTADGGILPGEGHLTLFTRGIGDIHAWLLDRLA